VQAKLSGAEPRTGEIMQGGLKRRLAKGGAQAEYALGNQLQRAKQAISKDGFEFQRIGQTVPLYSKSANWGPGEGKFQVIQNKASDAFDLNRATSDGLPGMGIEGKSRIITGQPHELGVEFANTHGLDPRYRDQGYGKQIYQNMADYYGGGISHSGSTTPEARHVYRSLGGIDTGIPSGGGTRQALPTTAMKADPEAMAAFQQKIDEYARQRSPIKGQETARQTLQDMIDQSSTRDIRDFEYQMQRATRSNGYVHESDISYLLDRIFNLNVQGGNVPNKIEIGGTTYIRLPNSAHFKKQQ